MGLRGPAPKEGALKPNQAAYEIRNLPPQGYQGEYPKLPSGHHRRTRQWYETWARSPQAAVFIATDWQRLQQLAYVVDELHDPKMEPVFNREGDVTGHKRISPAVNALMAEIRQCEKLLGASVGDRTSMYMRIGKPEQEEAPGSAETAATGRKRPGLRAVATG